MSTSVRKASQADISLMHFVRMSVTENRLSDHSRLGHADYEPFISDIGESWIVETEKGIAGFASINWSDASIWALFVHPEYEGHGYGKILL